MIKNIFAFTEPTNFPQFISINESEPNKIQITVRGHAKPLQGFGAGAMQCGDTVTADVTRDEIRALTKSLTSYLVSTRKPR